MGIIPQRYNLMNFRRIVFNPSIVFGEVTRYAQRINTRYYEWSDRSKMGLTVMNQDWDNLLILDACRYDAFKNEYKSHGELQMTQSLGTSSWEFMRKNFVGNKFHNTIYVTANPYTSKLDNDVFYRVYPLFQTCWDEELRTVPPDVAAKRARQALTNHPNKRLIVHFMQPHTPFIGELGEKIPHREDTSTADRMERSPDDTRDIWTNLQYGLVNIEIETVWEAYVENLQIVLEEVEELIEDIDGKTVITADHGELFGERLFPIPVRGYGHPEGIHVSKLKEIPWLEIKTEPRREITEGEPKEFHTDEETVEDRLVALGYK